MLASIRKRLTFGNVAIALALVLATSGGAYAAGRYVITSPKQIKPSVLNALKGKAGNAGPTGAAGPAGPVGPAGPAGPTGEKGSAGSNGKDGTNGKDGKSGLNGESVAATAVPTGQPACETLGGSEFKVGSSGTPTYACNGAAGARGPQGEPWTPNSALPTGATETGAWAVTENKSGGGFALVKTAISFTVGLAAKLTGQHVVAEPIGYAGTEEECPGTVAKPEAKSGYLCVYTDELHGSFGAAPTVVAPDVPVETLEQTLEVEASAGTAGAKLVIIATEEAVVGTGSWAVTG